MFPCLQASKGHCFLAYRPEPIRIDFIWKTFIVRSLQAEHFGEYLWEQRVAPHSERSSVDSLEEPVVDKKQYLLYFANEADLFEQYGRYWGNILRRIKCQLNH